MTMPLSLLMASRFVSPKPSLLISMIYLVAEPPFDDQHITAILFGDFNLFRYANYHSATSLAYFLSSTANNGKLIGTFRVPISLPLLAVDDKK